MSVKKPITINLNIDVVEKIDEFQKTNGISNRSAAVERLLIKALEGSSYIDEKSIEDIVLRIIEEKGLLVKDKNVESKKDNLELDDFSKAALSSFDEMAD